MNSNKLTDIKNNIKSEVKEKLGSIKGKSPPDNKRLIKIILIAVIVITILVTLTYFVGWLAEKLYDFMNVEYEARSDFFHCIGTALSGKVVPIFLWVTFAAVIIILGIFLWNIRRERSQPDGEQDDRNFTYSESGDFGTNRALRGYETTSVFNFQKELGESSEFIVGEDIDTGEIVTMKPIEESYRNPNIAIIGSPGTMKTRTVINNYMLQSIRQGRSVFCIDTKGSLYSDFYNLADSRGYTQRVLNLCEIDKSDGFDPLDIVKDDPDLVSIFAQTIIDNTSDEYNKDSFFDKGEMALLKAIALLVMHDGEPKGGYTHTPNADDRNFITIYKTIVTSTIEELSSTFAIISDIEPDHPAMMPWLTFLKGGQVSNNFVLGLASRLQLLQNPGVQKIFTHNDIDFDLPGKQKCIYYLRLPDTTSTYRFVSSLFITLLYKTLVTQADGNDSLVLDVLVTALLDEFCTAGKIPDFTDKISSVRSRGIASVIAIQNIPQIQDRYEGKAWEEILSDCDTMFFLGTNDNTTAQYISDTCGTTTIATTSQGYRYDSTISTSMMFNDSNSTNERNVYTPGEVKTMNIFEQLVLVRGLNVYKCKKLDYTKHPDYPKLVPKNITKHTPQYVLKGEDNEPQGSIKILSLEQRQKITGAAKREEQKKEAGKETDKKEDKKIIDVQTTVKVDSDTGEVVDISSEKTPANADEENKNNVGAEQEKTKSTDIPKKADKPTEEKPRKKQGSMSDEDRAQQLTLLGFEPVELTKPKRNSRVKHPRPKL